MNVKTLYSDRLVEITDDSILLRGYYFPFGGRRISFADISLINVEAASLWNGKYRLYGSGDLGTWFPLDWQRPSRHKLFFLEQKGKWPRVGFSVEDSTRVEQIMAEKGLLNPRRRAA
jgi:hypothetical protein